MRLLIDSHTLLWAVDQPVQLGAAARTALQDPANDLLLSAATIWEIAIKVGLKKLSLSFPYREWINKAICRPWTVGVANHGRVRRCAGGTRSIPSRSVRPTSRGAGDSRESTDRHCRCGVRSIWLKADLGLITSCQHPAIVDTHGRSFWRVIRRVQRFWVDADVGLSGGFFGGVFFGPGFPAFSGGGVAAGEFQAGDLVVGDGDLLVAGFGKQPDRAIAQRGAG